MGEVPADAATFLVAFGGGPVSPRVMVAELDALVSIVADRLCSLPATLDAARDIQLLAASNSHQSSHKETLRTEDWSKGIDMTRALDDRQRIAQAPRVDYAHAVP